MTRRAKYSTKTPRHCSIGRPEISSNCADTTNPHRDAAENLLLSGSAYRNENRASAVTVPEDRRVIDKKETPQVSVPSASVEPVLARQPIGAKASLAAKR